MHFGCICDNGPSHVMCAAAVGRALQDRGHRFTLFAFPHLRRWVEREGVRAVYLNHSQVMADRLEVKDGIRGGTLADIIQSLVHDVHYVHSELPKLIETTDLDCLIVDANVPAATSIAEAQSLPFVTLCIALPPHEEPSVPPSFLPWRYSDHTWARLRNRAAYRIRDFMVRPILAALNSFRTEHGLWPFEHLSDGLSPLAQVSQLVAEIDLPRTNLPGCFHYTGPYLTSREVEGPFPWERLNGRPLVYSALGTVLGAEARVWKPIAEACAPLDVQLVIALGAPDSKLVHMELPGQPIIVGYAPQRSLLARAALFITHAGLNSVLESLTHGVPLLAIPFMADQPGMACRIAHRRFGECVRGRARAESLRNTIVHLIGAPEYRIRCSKAAEAIAAAGGAPMAAEIFERAAVTREPVLRDEASDSIECRDGGES